MGTFSKVAAVVAAAALLAIPAVAQFRAGGGSLITNASVQKEIKLTDDQVEKVKKVAEDVKTKFKDSKLGKDATPEERLTQRKKVSAETNKLLADVLKADQLKRYKQIELQQFGLTDPDAQKELKLSDEQKDKIKKISEDTNEKRREIFKDAKGDFKGAMEKMTTLNKETSDKQGAILSDDQKKQWKEMTGDAFEVKFEPRAKTNN
jgi:Spy/CpxP family protein refolding chaperone